jgi:hypothetical protein
VDINSLSVGNLPVSSALPVFNLVVGDKEYLFLKGESLCCRPYPGRIAPVFPGVNNEAVVGVGRED